MPEVLAALDELGQRGCGSAETYQLLERYIQVDTSKFVPEQRAMWDEIRRRSLWTLGIMMRQHLWTTDSGSLPALGAIETVLKRRSEALKITLAAVECLWVLDRGSDQTIRRLLHLAHMHAVVEVKESARRALAGEFIPSPFPSSHLA